MLQEKHIDKLVSIHQQKDLVTFSLQKGITPEKEINKNIVIKEEYHPTNLKDSNVKEKKRKIYAPMTQLKGVKRFISAGRYVLNETTKMGELVEIEDFKNYSASITSSISSENFLVINEKKQIKINDNDDKNKLILDPITPKTENKRIFSSRKRSSRLATKKKRNIQLVPFKYTPAKSIDNVIEILDD